MKELRCTDPDTGETISALYAPHEQRAMLEFVAAGEREGVPTDALRREVAFLHELKSTFDAVLLPG